MKRKVALADNRLSMTYYRLTSPTRAGGLRVAKRTDCSRFAWPSRLTDGRSISRLQSRLCNRVLVDPPKMKVSKVIVNSTLNNWRMGTLHRVSRPHLHRVRHIGFRYQVVGASPHHHAAIGQLDPSRRDAFHRHQPANESVIVSGERNGAILRRATCPHDVRDNRVIQEEMLKCRTSGCTRTSGGRVFCLS